MPAATPRLVSAGSYWQRGFCTRRSTEAAEATEDTEMVEQKAKEKEEVMMVRAEAEEGHQEADMVVASTWHGWYTSVSQTLEFSRSS